MYRSGLLQRHATAYCDSLSKCFISFSVSFSSLTQTHIYTCIHSSVVILRLLIKFTKKLRYDIVLLYCSCLIAITKKKTPWQTNYTFTSKKQNTSFLVIYVKYKVIHKHGWFWFKPIKRIQELRLSKKPT